MGIKLLLNDYYDLLKLMHDNDRVEKKNCIVIMLKK